MKQTLKDLIEKVEKTTEKTEGILINGAGYNPPSGAEGMAAALAAPAIYRAFKFRGDDTESFLFTELYPSFCLMGDVPEHGYQGIFWGRSRRKVVLIRADFDDDGDLTITWHNPNTGESGSNTDGIRSVLGEGKVVYFLNLTRLKSDIEMPAPEWIVDLIAR